MVYSIPDVSDYSENDMIILNHVNDDGLSYGILYVNASGSWEIVGPYYFNDYDSTAEQDDFTVPTMYSLVKLEEKVNQTITNSIADFK